MFRSYSEQLQILQLSSTWTNNSGIEIILIILVLVYGENKTILKTLYNFLEL